MCGIFALLSRALLGLIIFCASGKDGDAQRTFDGTFFEVISGADKTEGEPVQGMFHKSFHQCGMDERCKFVAKNIKTSDFNRVFDENDLPRDCKNFIVWQKVAEKKIRGKQLGYQFETKVTNLNCSHRFTNSLLNLKIDRLAKESKAKENNIILFALFIHRRSNGGVTGGGGTCPPRFCNKQRSALFVFRKFPLSLMEKSFLEGPSPRLRCFLRPFIYSRAPYSSRHSLSEDL